MPSQPSIDIRLNLAASQAVAAMEMMQARLKKMQTGVNQNIPSKSRTNIFGNWATQLAKSFSIMAGLSGALLAIRGTFEAIRGEMENMLEISRNARDTQVPYGQRMEQIARLTSASPDQMTQIDKMVRRSGIPNLALAGQMVEIGISATSNTMPLLDRAAVGLDIGSLIPEVVANDPQAARAFAAAAGKSAQTFKGQGGDMRAQLGLFFSALKESPTSDPEQFAKSVFPAAKKLVDMQPGFTQQEAMAYIVGFQNKLEDKEGDITTTGVLKNMAYMQRAALQAANKDISGMNLQEFNQFTRGNSPAMNEIRKKALGLRNRALTDEERQEMIDVANGSKVISDIPARSRFKFAQQDAWQLGGDVRAGGVNEQMSAALLAFGAKYDAQGKADRQASYETNRKMLATSQATIDGMDIAGPAKLNRALERSKARLDMQNDPYYALRMEQFDEVMQAAGDPALLRWWDRTKKYVTEDGRGSRKTLLEMKGHVEDQIQFRQGRDFLSQQDSVTGFFGAMLKGGRTPTEEMRDPRNKEIAIVLNELSAAITALTDQMGSDKPQKVEDVNAVKNPKPPVKAPAQKLGN